MNPAIKRKKKNNQEIWILQNSEKKTIPSFLNTKTLKIMEKFMIETAQNTQIIPNIKWNLWVKTWEGLYSEKK